MPRLDSSLGVALLSALLSALFIIIASGTALCQTGPADGEVSNQIVINVYIDDTGRALINGYVDDLGEMAFLNSSEYTYDDESRQIYAVTSALTSKSGDNWTLSLELEGSYDEYHIMFYLPGDTKLKQVGCSPGLECLVYAASESFVADVQGYDVTGPVINIEYLLPLVETSGTGGDTDADIDADTDIGYPYLAAVLLILSAIGLSIVIFRLRSRSGKPAEYPGPYRQTEALATFDRDPLASSISIESTPEAGRPAAPPPLPPAAEGGSRISEIAESPRGDEKVRGGGENIKLTGEIAAVMATLTDKEQCVVRSLLRRGGRMTQTEIKYETDISKSSLSGILTSMEKRRIITKREHGRTNVIELSERFLNSQERS